MFNFIWCLMNIITLATLTGFLIYNVYKDAKNTQIKPEKRKSIIVTERKSEEANLTIIYYFRRVISLMAIFVSIGITYLILDLSEPLLDYIKDIQKISDLSKGALIISFFTAGHFFTKLIFKAWAKTNDPEFIKAIRARGLVSGFLGFAQFALLLNFTSQLRGEYIILRGLNIAFVTGMGFYLIFEKLPFFKFKK